MRNWSLISKTIFEFHDDPLSLYTTDLFHFTNSIQFIFQVLKKPNYFKQNSHLRYKQKLHGATKYGKVYFRKYLFHAPSSHTKTKSFKNNSNMEKLILPICDGNPHLRKKHHKKHNLKLCPIISFWQCY